MTASGADLCFAHVCDMHVTGRESARIVAAAVGAINAAAPDFAVFGGDLTDQGDAGAYTALQEAVGGLRAPAHFLMGNHDMVSGKAGFEARFGPASFAFDCGGAHIIGLDSTGRTSLTWGGLFTGRAVSWLAQHLAGLRGDRPAILFTHHGIWSAEPYEPKRNLLWDVLNWRPVHRLLSGLDLVLACAGHAHENVRQQWGRTVMLWTAALSSVRANHEEEPPGFRLVWVKGRAVSTEWVRVEG